MSRENRQQRRQAINTPGHAHELTFSCYRKFAFLKAERTCNWLVEAINQARAKHAFHVWAFVFMPNHVHMIIRPVNPEYEMRAIMSGIKLPVGRRAMAYLEEQQSPWLEQVTRIRRGRKERLFWQSGGGYDRNVTSANAVMRMIDYIHQNPVRRGLTECARNWKWSSAAWFEGGDSPLLIDPIPPEWLLNG